LNALITGFPGTGKSAITGELKRRGYYAYDIEHIPGMVYCRDRQTGRKITPPEPVPSGWYDTVGEQVWDVIKLEQLLSAAHDVFICAFTHTIFDDFSLFDRCFLLTLDDMELEQRLLSRPGNTIGKNPRELSDILLRRKEFEARLLEKGALELNARTEPKDLVTKVLDICYDHRPLA